MTITQAKREARKFGIVIERTRYEDIRVNYVGGKEATAYYTNDVNDALATAEHMARH